MMDYVQTELNLGIAGIPAHNQEWRSPQYDPAWDETPGASHSTCESVGEQVSLTTKKIAHQHDTEVTHWIETYWVKRGINKYWYYRYTWMHGRKLRRKYIGSTNSARAKKIKSMIEGYIRQNLPPDEITTLITRFSTTTSIH